MEGTGPGDIQREPQEENGHRLLADDKSVHSSGCISPTSHRRDGRERWPSINSSVHWTCGLRNAYHQISFKDEDKPYTAFEADNKLYQFKRIPFGITNGVASFQRVIDDIVEKEGLEDTFVYIDNVTVCGHSQEEHDENLKKFRDAVEKYRLTLNKDKCIFSTRSVNLLGYLIEEGSLRPDPERLRPFLDLPEPRDISSLRRVIGMFTHYSRLISHFSEKIHPLAQTISFPLSPAAKSAFAGLKAEIASTAIRAIDPIEPFVVETDASEHAIAATLCQAGRPVAFFSRTLSSLRTETFGSREGGIRHRRVIETLEALPVGSSVPTGDRSEVGSLHVRQHSRKQDQE